MVGTSEKRPAIRPTSIEMVIALVPKASFQGHELIWEHNRLQHEFRSTLISHQTETRYNQQMEKKETKKANKTT